MSIDNRVQPKEGESIFAAECRQHGLDPKRTSMHTLECVKYGLDPKRTSINDLKAAGSQLYNR